jgi:6-phosphogluconolactonase
MRRTLPLSLLATLAGVLLLGAGLASARQDRFSPIVGHVYVNDNTAASNTIAAFDRHADGTLTPVPGSPFATGGAGTGMGIGSQGALQETANGRYLLAVDAGSNQISVLRIGSDGGLQPVDVASSGGSKPVSLAIHGHLVYVANAGAGASNYTGFRLHHGDLEAIPGSTVALPDTANPGDVLFNSTGTNLVGIEVGGTLLSTSKIDSFAVGGGGRLTPAPGSPFPAQALGPFGSAFRPTNPSQLFVSNAHAGAGLGTVSAFQVGGDGTLTSIGGSPFPDGQTAPCWVEISHDGAFLFAVNTASQTISRYFIRRDGTLVLIGSTPMRGISGPEDARLSPDGSTLWVVDTGAGKVSGFAVDGGDLTELASSPAPLPAGATAFGIVVN